MNKLVNKASNWLEINLDNLEYNFKGIKIRYHKAQRCVWS